MRIMFKNLADRFIPSKRQFIDRITLYHGEILKTGGCDAIAFFMTPSLMWQGSLNQEILALAGPALDQYVLEHVESPHPGEVFKLPGFKTPFKSLFMIILNTWDGGVDFDDNDMVRAYRRTVLMAQEAGLKTLAFPAMGHDKRDFPHLRFARLALQGISQGLDGRMNEVKIVCRDQRMVDTYSERIQKLS
jgi:O-acetyl-ADP-ribose deacetylase (regulator of RNase III)